MQLTPQQQALLDGAQGETMAKVVMKRPSRSTALP